MSTTVQSLNELPLETVQQAEATATQLVQEQHPDLELRRGVVHDLVIAPSAILATATQEEIDRWRRSSSLQAIAADPTLADDAMVDALAANYRMTRKAGAVATGSVTIILGQSVSVTIGQGTVFTANGLNFITQYSFASRTSSANVTATTDRVLTPLDDGTYAFTIEVVAEDVGNQYQLSKDTLMVPQILLPYVVKAYAAADFTGGAAAESNADLAARVATSTAAKALSGRLNMTAALVAQFPNIVADSIIGFGDIEMLRDQHTIWPGSVGGGRVDWYVRVQELPQKLTLIVTATLVEKQVDGTGIWQFSLGRDSAPGFYDVCQITKTTAANVSGGYPVVGDVRSVDLTALDNDGLLPDVVGNEAVYSRFQAATIQFHDTETNTDTLTVLSSTQPYSVVVRCMPQLAEIQDYMSARGVRNYGGDVLVKAPIPCFLSLSLTIAQTPGDTAPDTAAIQVALAQAVNRFGFTGKLPAGYLADVVHNNLGGRKAYLSAIDMFGRIRQPDGNYRYVRATDVLSVPTDAANMCSGRTVAFYLDPSDVAIAVTTADVAEV